MNTDAAERNALWGLSTDFEFSTAGWQTFLLPRYPPSLLDFEWETENPGMGTRSAVLRPGFGVNSFPFAVKPDTTYTFSALARADEATTLHLIFGVNPRVWDVDVEIVEIDVSAEWKRVSASFRTPTDIKGGLFLLLENRADPEETLSIYVASFTVSEGSSNEYDPGPYSFGLTTGVFGNFFAENREVTVTASLRIHDSNAISSNGWTWILNEVVPTEKKMLEGAIDWTRDGDGILTAKLTIPKGQGLYRVIAHHEDDEDILPFQELLVIQAQFAGLPSPPENPDESFFGVHFLNNWMEIDHAPWRLNLHSSYDRFLERIHHFGARWIRLHGGRPDPTKTYETHREGPGTLRVYNEEMRKVRAAGFQILGMLQPAYNTHNHDKPPWFDYKETRGAWMGDMIPTDPAVWKKCVAEVVAAYRDEIGFWEIYNEPNGQMTANDYVPLLKAGYEAAKAANPDSTILGICTTSDFCTESSSFVTKCLDQGAGDYLDVISFHPYAGIQSPESGGVREIEQSMRNMRDEYAPGKPLWNSEVGWPTRSTYVSHRQWGSQDDTVPPLAAAAYNTRGILLSRRMGLERYFMYDGVAPLFCLRNTAFSPLFEYDGTPNASYLVVGTAVRLLQGATCEKALDLAEGVYAYLFRKGDDSVLAAVWLDNQVRKNPFHLELSVCATRGWDGAGRPLNESEEVVEISMISTWLSWRGKTVDEVEGIIRNSSLAEQKQTAIVARVDPEDSARIALSCRNPGSEALDLTWKPVSNPAERIGVPACSESEIAALRMKDGRLRVLRG